MSRQKREKLTTTTVPEKPQPQQSFVQLEGKLTEEQLEAIAGGQGCPPDECGSNHNETMVSNSILKQVIMSKPKLKLLGTPEKPRPQQPLVQLTEEQLEAIGFASARSAIAGGFDGRNRCNSVTCNHNEIVVSIKETE